MKLYEQKLMDHFRNPRHRKQLEEPDFTSQEYIPSCGDRIVIQGHIHNGQLEAIGFTGSGCVISQATASILCDYAIGKETAELLAFDKNDMLSMLSLSLGPNRMQCALLALHALQSGIVAYNKKVNENSD